MKKIILIFILILLASCATNKLTTIDKISANFSKQEAQKISKDVGNVLIQLYSKDKTFLIDDENSKIAIEVANTLRKNGFSVFSTNSKNTDKKIIVIYIKAKLLDKNIYRLTVKTSDGYSINQLFNNNLLKIGGVTLLNNGG